MAQNLIGMATKMMGAYIEGSDEATILRDVKRMEEIFHFIRTGE